MKQVLPVATVRNAGTLSPFEVGALRKVAERGDAALKQARSAYLEHLKSKATRPFLACFCVAWPSPATRAFAFAQYFYRRETEKL